MVATVRSSKTKGGAARSAIKTLRKSFGCFAERSVSNGWRRTRRGRGLWACRLDPNRHTCQDGLSVMMNQCDGQGGPPTLRLNERRPVRTILRSPTDSAAQHLYMWWSALFWYRAPALDSVVHALFVRGSENVCHVHS